MPGRRKEFNLWEKRKLLMMECLQVRQLQNNRTSAAKRTSSSCPIAKAWQVIGDG